MKRFKALSFTVMKTQLSGSSSHSPAPASACFTSVTEFMQRMAPQDEQAAPPLSSSLVCHIFLLSCILERSANREAERHQLTVPQWMALGCIGNEGKTGITHSDLCHRLMLSKAPVTGIVDRLVRDGFARRATDTKDRRVSRIAIKPKGEAAWRRVRDAMREHSDALCANFSINEQETLISLLSRLMESVARTDPLLPDWDGKSA
jgi:MarR family 2-MHQ and catechol resistance regulon transcriptional repressor